MRPSESDRVFSPLTLLLAFQVPLLILFLLVSRGAFFTAYGSQKAMSGLALAYFALALAAYGLGALIGTRLPIPTRAVAQRSPEQTVRAMRFVVYVGLGVGILAYILWFGLGVVKAGGPLALLHAYASSPYYVHTTLLETVPGVTTLIELPIAAIALALAYGIYRERYVLALIGIVVVFVLMRVVLDSSRLSLYELLVPLFYLFGRRWTRWRLLAMGAGFLAAFVAVFLISDALRLHGFSIQARVFRLAGYYLNSINNGFVAAAHYSSATPLWANGQMLWKFPVLSDFISYQKVVHVDIGYVMDPYYEANGVSPAYTTFTLPGQLALDFGWLGVYIMSGVGLASGLFYRLASLDPFYRAIYAVWLVGIVELMRENYFATTAVAPIYLLFAVAYVVRRYAASGRRSRVPQSEADPDLAMP